MRKLPPAPEREPRNGEAANAGPRWLRPPMPLASMPPRSRCRSAMVASLVLSRIPMHQMNSRGRRLFPPFWHSASRLAKQDLPPGRARQVRHRSRPPIRRAPSFPRRSSPPEAATRGDRARGVWTGATISLYLLQVVQRPALTLLAREQSHAVARPQRPSDRSARLARAALHAGAAARLRRLRAQRRGDGGVLPRPRRRAAAACQDPQVGRDRAQAARGRRHRHLLRDHRRGRAPDRRRHRQPADHLADRDRAEARPPRGRCRRAPRA